MSRTQSPLTVRGLELIRAGRSLREAAELMGVAPSTLARAAAKAGLMLPRGRRPVAK